MRAVSDFLDRYSATFLLVMTLWVIGTAAFALTVNFHIGMMLMLAPIAILSVGGFFAYLIGEAIREIRGER